MVSQLKQGIKVEKEHIGTWSWVKKQCKSGKCPSTDDILRKIAKDHLAEDPTYYKKLKKYGL